MAPSPQRTAVQGKARGRHTLPAFSPGAAAIPGITLEILEGPMDGLVLSSALDRIRIGRVGGNDLELHSDRSVSGDHALLSRTEDPHLWRLEDPPPGAAGRRGSTNGTWVDDVDVRLSGARTVPIDTCFMVGHAVIHCAPRTGDESFAPDARQIQEEAARLRALLAPRAAEGYGAAIVLAATERRPFLADRHLFLGLAMTNPELPILAHGKGPVTSRFLAETLRRNEHWTGASAWIDRRLRTSAIDGPVLFQEDLVTTPRLLRILLAAEEEARQAGSELIRPEDVFRAFLTGPANRPRDLLVREGINPPVLLALLASSPAEPAPPGSPERRAPAFSQAASQAAPPSPPLATSGDPALDNRAQEAARRLYGVASLYHLANAEDRYMAMRQLLVQEVAQLPAESRPRLLQQLERLFPVVSGAVAAADLEETRSRRKTDGKREASTPERLPTAGGEIPWEALLSGAREIDLDAVGPRDRTAVELAAEVLSFALGIERFVVGIVQNLRSPGIGTETFQLPGYRTSIKHFVRELKAGKPLRRGALREYLTALETWLIAAIAAYHESPEVWFKEFWRKVSPSVIESRLSEDWKARMGLGNEAKCWSHYKEKVKTLSPDLIHDEILQVVRRRADEQYQQLFERRKPS